MCARLWVNKMSKLVMPRCIVAFNFYQEAIKHFGVVSVKLPEIDLRPGKNRLARLQLTVYFASMEQAAQALKCREWQRLEIRSAEESWSLEEAVSNCYAVRHIANARPLKFGAGNVQSDESLCPYIVYEVSYYKTEHDGEKELEVDTAAQICTIGGEDFSNEVFAKR